ncbi:MAG: hypothetical protein PHJ00_01505 [Candidatus Omnitrophica bacterium]|nr:hypothetical protein [Candidatus Omnitrophota bacterium]MDD5654778.1 hypothetical protein [Candidatus Omnitrophota bacterium]
MDNSSVIKGKKAQVTLETALVFVALIMLLYGSVNIWLWFNRNLAERQPPYNQTRVTAGSSNPGQWPVSSQKPLTESWVFQGK